jgi:hypothetical protein
MKYLTFNNYDKIQNDFMQVWEDFTTNTSQSQSHVAAEGQSQSA